MLNKATLILTVPMMILASCGTKKKLAQAQTEIDDLVARNAQLTQNVDQLKKESADLNTRYQASVEDFNRYKKTCEQNTMKLQAMRSTLDEEEESFQKLEDKLNEALADFNDKGVDVYTKDGYLLVSLPDDLLYKSGSAKLDDKGRQALSSLASVLNDYPRLKVVVLGNTDDAQFKKGAGDNWSLSTERANGVVRVLRDDYKVDPARLTAAGKGKYNPIADNSTAEGRAKNRRTDIILNPDFERIWRSIKNE